MCVKAPKIRPGIPPPVSSRNSPLFLSLIRRFVAPILDGPNPQILSRSPTRAAFPVS